MTLPARAALALAAVLLAWTPAAAGAVSVPLYGLYELTVDYAAVGGQDHGYADPFYGVELQATFSSPTGRQVDWFGFFDGDGLGGQAGNVWKIRFMPDEPGVWSLTWQFGDASLSSASPETFEAVLEGARPGPLRRDATIPQWLITADGARPVFLNMYAEDLDAYRYDAYNAPQAIVQGVVDEGFDVVFSSGPIHHEHRDLPKDATNPWIYEETQSYTPRLAGWHLLEQGLLQQAYDAGVFVYEFYGFYGGNDVIDLHTRPEAVQNAVLKYQLTRTAPYYMYLYNVGFELDEYVSVPDWPMERAAYIKALDPWGHPVTAHELGGFSYGDAAYESLIEFSALQQFVSLHFRAVAIWNSGSRPHAHCNECIWNAPWQPPGTEESHRRSLWSMITGGMSAAFFARDNSIGLAAFRHANRFLSGGVRWWEMEPHDELASDEDVFVLAQPGVEYLSYICRDVDGCPSNFSLDLAPGDYRVRWFDPATEVYSDWTALDWAGGPAPFVKPDPEDRVLWVADAALVAVPSVALSADPPAPLRCESVILTVAVDGFGAAAACTIDYGDTTSRAFGGTSPFIDSGPHVYAEPGDYLVDVSCDDGTSTQGDSAGLTVSDDPGGACDNCPDTPNPDQSDLDADGVGDVCDNCPFTGNPGQSDSDLDGLGNACDDCNGSAVDADGDGFRVCDGDCRDSDPNNWTSCFTCSDLDGDGFYSDCDAYVTIQGPDCDDTDFTQTTTCCAVSSLLVTLRGRAPALDDLYAFRERLSAGRPDGERYVALYYRHTGEIASMLLRRPELRVEATAQLERFLPRLHDLLAGVPVQVTESERAAVVRLIEALVEGAGTRMSIELLGLRQELLQGDVLESLGVSIVPDRGPSARWLRQPSLPVPPR